MLLFNETKYLKTKLFYLVCVSLLLLFFERVNVDFSSKCRGVLNNTLSGIYYLVNIPNNILENLTVTLTSKQKLVAENQRLKQKLQKQQASLLLLEQLVVENKRLRLLLGSPLRNDEYKKIAQVVSVSTDKNRNYSRKIVINKGSQDGVFMGQPLITEEGLLGQIISVSIAQSEALLIIDTNSTTPVRNVRTNMMTTVSGTGEYDNLNVDYVPLTADIQVGDMLVTSGLDGKYPEGYPVAKIKTIKKNRTTGMLEISAEPLASMGYISDLLLLYNVAPKDL